MLKTESLMKKFFLTSIKLIFPLTILFHAASAFAIWLPLSCSVNLISADGTAQSSTEFFLFKKMPLPDNGSTDLDISKLGLEGISVEFHRVDKGLYAYPIHAVTVYENEKMMAQTTHVYTQGAMQLRVPVVKNNDYLFLNVLCSKRSSPIRAADERLTAQVFNQAEAHFEIQEGIAGMEL